MVAGGVDGLAASWAEALWRACWQGGLALGVVLLLDRAVPRSPPRARCWLRRLAYLKLLIACGWATPVDLPLLPAGEGGGGWGRRGVWKYGGMDVGAYGSMGVRKYGSPDLHTPMPPYL